MSHHINQRHLAPHDRISRAPQGRAEVLRVGDWSFTMDAHAARNHRIVNIRIFKRCADSGIGDAPLMAVGHPLDMHDLLMIGTVVVHDAEQRNAMMCGGPQRARSVHEITVILYADAKPAILPVRKRGAEFSQLEVRLLTGRTHQIRVHLAHAGHPVLGDDKYGDFELNRRVGRGEFRVRLTRMFLHAGRVRLQHPVSGEPIAFASPLAPECEAFLQALRDA